jgi:hypothetical protein
VTGNRLIVALKELDPNLFSRLHREITEARLYNYLQPLADTLAPSQTVRHTRAPVLEQLLRTDCLLERPNVHFERNYQNTGNSVLLLGQQPQRKRVWLLAHNVALIGFLGENRHFDKDVTSANIKDLVDLARVVVCYVLLTQTPIWREVMGL